MAEEIVKKSSHVYMLEVRFYLEPQNCAASHISHQVLLSFSLFQDNINGKENNNEGKRESTHRRVHVVHVDGKKVYHITAQRKAMWKSS